VLDAPGRGKQPALYEIVNKINVRLSVIGR
jgi:hypothetical protein